MNRDDARKMHDDMLHKMPDGASHNADLCQICVDWAVSSTGVPANWDSENQKPYGDVEYADPGTLADGVHRYPVDTLNNAKASLNALQTSDARLIYKPEDYAKVHTNVDSALKNFNQHQNSADEKADNHSNLDEEGKAKRMDNPIAQETHEALLDKAVQDAVKSAQTELAELKDKVSAAESERDELKEKVDTLTEENERLNSELDTAQVQVKSHTDEIETLKTEIASRDEAQAKSKVADERAEEIRALGLFSDDYIQEKAERWADVPDEEWADRVDEWKNAKGSQGTSTEGPTDNASQMNGSSEGNQKTASARKRVLGLA